MLDQITRSLLNDLAEVRSQVNEIAAWLGIEPMDAALFVASIGGLLAYIF